MQRLAFTSAETLDAYCEQVRADLSSRREEQRRLVETALQRLDQLEAQANAMHSDDLATEIAARRNEGRQLLAKLTTLNGGGEPLLSNAPVIETPPTFVHSETQAELNDASAFDLAPNGHSPFHEPEQPLSATSTHSPSDPAAVPASAFAAPFESGAAQIEALWQQPVDLKSEARDATPETLGTAPTTTATTEPEAHIAGAEAVIAFGEPVAQLSESSPEDLATEPLTEVAVRPEIQLPTFGQAAVLGGVEPIAFGAPAAAESQTPVAPVPSESPKAITEAIPAGLNWSWGSESESPAWAELLVEDAPVPIEPLTDSHFGQLPSLAEVANATPAEPPPAAEKANGAHHPLVLNVKVGEWGSEHPLSKSELFVGRRDLASRCKPDVEVMYDQAVSRRHLRISKDNGSYLVEDLDSTNGTTLNGRSLRPGHPEILKAGDEMEIGEFTLLKIASV